jgi:hypothetical protein
MFANTQHKAVRAGIDRPKVYLHRDKRELRREKVK